MFNRSRALASSFALVSLAALAAFSAGCGPSTDSRTPNRTPLADKWFSRAKQSYKAGDMEDAASAVESALRAGPSDPDIRLLGARIALAKLDYPTAVKLTAGLDSTEAHGIRGRAQWYAGDIEPAADELEAMLQDPTVKDPWAREVAKLARHGGARHPFSIEGGLVGSVEMPRAGSALVVPCELDGERILAVIATASSEVIIDSSSRHEASWVNFTFGGVEVKDVPATAQDLGALSRQLGAPIKALLGVNLLRHVHATFDRHGDQFIVRKEEASAPPGATRVPLWYIRGGGMSMTASVSPRADDKMLMLIDSSALYPLALGDASWKVAGVNIASLTPEPAVPNAKSGVVPQFKLASFDLPKVPAVSGVMDELAASVDLDLGGVVGSGVLSIFRVTFGDEGSFAWFEPDPTMLNGGSPPAAEPVSPSAPAEPASPRNQLGKPTGGDAKPESPPGPAPGKTPPGSRPKAGSAPAPAPASAKPAADKSTGAPSAAQPAKPSAGTP